MSKYLRTDSLCLLILSLSYQAYGCTLDGIDIQKMLSPIVQQSSGGAKAAKSSVQQKSKVKIDLVTILSDSNYRTTSKETVKVQLSKDSKSEDFSDTDEEKEKKKEKEKNIEARKPTKVLAGMGNKNKKDCLLTQTGWAYSRESPECNTKQLCENLALDAYEIANIGGAGEYTTCFCVLLRDYKRCVHKIVFHSAKGQLAPTMRNKAGDLNYTVRNARNGHAEAQLISFLLTRMKQKNPPLQYGHVIGMGCSRRNCLNCAVLLKFFLGKKGYTDFHAYVSEEKCAREKIRMERHKIDGKTKIVRTTPEQINHAEAVYPGSETGNYSKNDYLLPENIREVLEEKLGRSLHAE